MNKTSLNFYTENHSPFFIKMQKPKDALFRDHLKYTLQNVIWIHIRESSIQANFCQHLLCINCVSVKEAEQFYGSIVNCDLDPYCRVQGAPAEESEMPAMPTGSCVTSSKALHPKERLFPHRTNADSDASLTYLKNLQKSKNRIKLVASSSFLFIFPLQNYLVEFIMCHYIYP